MRRQAHEPAHAGPDYDDPDAPERHETQYFEMFGNRGIYHRGWTAVTKHRTPWVLVGGEQVAFDDDVWELNDTGTGWSQARDLAAEHPDRLHELQRLWLIEAARHGVLPLDDRTGERIDLDAAGRPVLVHGNRQVLFGGMGRLPRAARLQRRGQLGRDRPGRGREGTRPPDRARRAATGRHGPPIARA